MSDTERAHDAVTECVRALDRLDEALREPVENPLAVDGTIQRFEFTWELFWRLLKRVAEAEGLEARSPKGALRAAFRLGLLDEERLWLDALEDRNRTTHTYKEQVAREVYSRVGRYARAMRDVVDRVRGGLGAA